MNDIITVRRRPILNLIKRAYASWSARHRSRFNFWIHMIGIPLAFGGLLAVPASFFFSFIPWYSGVAAFVLGYVLQYWGHQVEGNDVGEWAAIKHLLGMRYNTIAKRWSSEREEAPEHVSSWA
jgi:uncharacterized membrane protein YGL010W